MGSVRRASPGTAWSFRSLINRPIDDRLLQLIQVLAEVHLRLPRIRQPVRPLDFEVPRAADRLVSEDIEDWLPVGGGHLIFFV